jgi:hypothetical protein
MRFLLFVAVSLFGLAAVHPAFGQACTNVNNLIVCPDGTVGNRFGNRVYWSDGTSSAGVPRTTFVNPPSVPRSGSEPEGPVDGRVDRNEPDAPATQRWPSLGR